MYTKVEKVKLANFSMWKIITRRLFINFLFAEWTANCWVLFQSHELPFFGIILVVPTQIPPENQNFLPSNQGVRNNNFSENLSYVLNGWFLSERLMGYVQLT